MGFKEYIEDVNKSLIILEALRVVKKLKDKIKDGSEEAFQYLKLGKIKNYTINKSKHSLEDRDGVRRDVGVPTEIITDTIKKTFNELKPNKETVVIFKYKEKYNMIIIVKNTKYKEIKIKTEILQNRSKNTYKFKDTDDSIILENLDNYKFILL